ncbi:hypothetical protein [Oxalobacter paraformigenes]|uniref:hypothetical protein n=1 Tax=Oxalobacter paraformigenes TaxID=556268 RepID=UPI0003196697|nr:hypothetical protein [Oxalobacter paraformigenes]
MNRLFRKGRKSKVIRSPEPTGKPVIRYFRKGSFPNNPERRQGSRIAAGEKTPVFGRIAKTASQSPLPFHHD